MKTLVATHEVWYDGRKRNPGDQFNASDIDATILCARDVSGGARARLAELPPSVPVVKAPPKTTPLEIKVEPTKAEPVKESTKAEPELPEKLVSMEAQPDLQAEEPEATGRRRYKRRDLKAEGE